MVPYILKQIGVARDELIVDVGAAQGHGLIPAYCAGYEKLAAVDIDPWNFSLFEDRYRIRTFRCDVERESLPFRDGEVSALMCLHLIEHLQSPRLFISEVYRVLRPKGRFVIVTPDWQKQYKIFWRDPTHVHPYDKVSIARLLRMHGFQDVRTHSWGPRYGMGRLHAFRWFPRLGMIGIDMLALGSK